MYDLFYLIDFFFMHEVYFFLLTIINILKRIISFFLSCHWVSSKSLICLSFKVVKWSKWVLHQIFIQNVQIQLFLLWVLMEIDLSCFVYVDQKISFLQVRKFKKERKVNFLTLSNHLNLFEYLLMEYFINQHNDITYSDTLLKLI